MKRNICGVHLSDLEFWYTFEWQLLRAEFHVEFNCNLQISKKVSKRSNPFKIDFFLNIFLRPTYFAVFRHIHYNFKWKLKIKNKSFAIFIKFTKQSSNHKFKHGGNSGGYCGPKRIDGEFTQA